MAINWTSELKRIERAFDGLPPLPPVPSPAQLKARRASERRTLERTLERQERTAMIVGTGGRFVLVFALAMAINFWPYGHACGFGLFTYLFAELLIIIGGLWTVAWTWRHRMVRGHAVAMVMVLWGIALVAAQVLPRVGYAAEAAKWWCS
ncbi:MAG TPA: hypothetical protein VK807_19465 [Gemmatimonadaceae bacterium]|jgi:hypothetical protein|nr:hypothetical protein [Gemmatimonadaceae bacterium]